MSQCSKATHAWCGWSRAAISFPGDYTPCRALLIYFSSGNAAITRSRLPRTRGCHTWAGDTHIPTVCQAGSTALSQWARASSGTNVTLRSQELTTSFTPGPRDTCTPSASPALRDTQSVAQEVPSRQTQPGGHKRGRRSWKEPQGSSWLCGTLCKLRWCHPMPPVKCRCNSQPAADKGSFQCWGHPMTPPRDSCKDPALNRALGPLVAPKGACRSPVLALLGWPPPPSSWILPCLGPGLRARAEREGAQGLPEAVLVTSQAVLWGGDRAEDSTQLTPHSNIRAAFSQHHGSAGLLQEQLQALLRENRTSTRSPGRMEGKQNHSRKGQLKERLLVLSCP